MSASLRFATGNLWCALQTGSAQTGWVRTARHPNTKYPKDTPWRVPVCIGFVFWFLSLVSEPDSPVLAGPVMRPKSGIRAAHCLSRRRVWADPAFGVQRRLPEAQRRDPDCGSPFLWLCPSYVLLRSPEGFAQAVSGLEGLLITLQHAPPSQVIDEVFGRDAMKACHPVFQPAVIGIGRSGCGRHLVEPRCPGRACTTQCVMPLVLAKAA